MKDFVLNLLRGALMGAANVVPGVSGGTMALLTGIFEKLVNAIKAFDAEAIRLFLRFRFKELFRHIDLPFLAAVGSGVLISILSLARLLEYLFDRHELYVWSFFFGLILASIYFVGNKIKKFDAPVIVLFLFGTAIAAALAFAKPATENASLPYLLACGAIAMCSMILPGLSGSFVLLLMGNYELVMVRSIAEPDLKILIPFAVGGVLGLAAFARLLSVIFRKFPDRTLALLTGFIAGSLAVIWPWKEPSSIRTIVHGDRVKEIVEGYAYRLPDLSAENLVALALLLAGILALACVELLAVKKKAD